MALQKTKPRLEVGTAPVEATLTGIDVIRFRKEDNKKDLKGNDLTGKVKAYVFDFDEYESEWFYYSHDYPKYNDELKGLVKQLSGTGIEFDDEEMDEVIKDYIGTVIYVCKQPSKDYKRGNLCFDKDWKPEQ